MIKIKQLFYEDSSIPIKNLDNNQLIQNNENLSNKLVRGRKIENPGSDIKKINSLTNESKQRMKKGKLRTEKQITLSESEESSYNSDYSNIKRIRNTKISYLQQINLNKSTNSFDEIKNNPTNEEKVFIEVEKILSELIYNHITNDEKKNECDVLIFEKQINYISDNLNKHHNIFILQILCEKIKEIVQQLKDKFLDISDIKQFKNIYYGINKPKSSDILNHKLLLKSFLTEIRNIKCSLISCSKDVEKVFNKPLMLIFKTIRITFENVFVEVFDLIILKDDFIKEIITHLRWLILECKYIDEEDIVEFIEEDNDNNGMTVFVNYLDKQINKLIRQNEKEQKEILKSNKNKNLGLDELLEYIQSEEIKPKKKNKKKKKEKDTYVKDIEIENFRINLLNNSQKAYNVKKIKPMFSDEWINSLNI